MGAPIDIITVIDNSGVLPGLTTQWGLSFWIETESARVLLDCGASAAALENARRLELPLQTLDTFVLSHGHYDHGGGIAPLTAAAPQALLVMHPGALVSRYLSNRTGKTKQIGLTERDRAAVLNAADRFVPLSGPLEIAPGVWASGPIPRRHPLELPEPSFFLDAACTVPDHVIDDQALWIHTPRGLVVVTGCAHAGLINTLEYARAVAGLQLERAPGGHARTGAKVRAVIGGFHLLHARRDQLEATAAYLEDLDLEVCAPCHCTGKRATNRLRERLGEVMVNAGSGARFVF